jgi:hypothetical protein
MLLEAIAAGLVGVALLWLVLQPMLFPAAAPAISLDPLDPEETPRGQALLALKEIEFDRATGKLSQADFDLLNTRYQAVAVAAQDRGTVQPRCLTHGPRAERAAQFCAVCGAGLVTADDCCVACGRPAATGARFCAGCGVGLRA